MENNKLFRRNFVLKTALGGASIVLAGCSGSDGSPNGDNDTPTESNNLTEESNSQTEVATPETETQTPVETSVFNSYEIDGEDFTIVLADNVLDDIETLRLTTPGEEFVTEVRDTIAEYSFTVQATRAGEWYIDALDNGNIIESVEVTTTFGVTTKDIGTLKQLGVTGASPFIEETSIQLTVVNQGEIPIEPVEIEIAIPEFSNSPLKFDQYGGLSSRLVDRDENLVISSGESNTYRYSGIHSNPILKFSEQSIQSMMGKTFPGEITIQYRGKRKPTIVPINVELSGEILSGSQFKAPGSNDTIAEETIISKR